MAEQLNETNTEKTYTQAEMDAYAQKEADRRVTEALKTQERKTAAKIKEAEKLAAMNEQEKFQYELDKKSAELEDRERALTMAENKIAGLEILSDKGLDSDLIDLVLSTDADEMHVKINLLEESFNNAVKAEVEKRLAGSTPVRTQTGNTGMTKEQFSKLTLSQKTELYNKDPETYRAVTQ